MQKQKSLVRTNCSTVMNLTSSPCLLVIQNGTVEKTVFKVLKKARRED